MKRLWVLLPWLLGSLNCPAAEIVSWKIPLERYLANGLDAKGVVRMASAPEASPFFKEGDVLWDIKGINAKDGAPDKLARLADGHRNVANHPPEWAVWNASAERLVIKADWLSIFNLNERLRINEMPKQIRLTAEFSGLSADGATASEKDQPAVRQTWVSRPGQAFSVSSMTDAAEVKLSGVGECYGPFIDLKLNASCSIRNQPRFGYDGHFSLRPGIPSCVARDFDGTNGLACKVSGRIELMDGTPLDEAALIQKHMSFEPLEKEFREPMRTRIGEKGWLIVCSVAPGALAEWLDPDPDPAGETDPFAEHPSAMFRKPLDLEEVMVPDDLKARFSQPVFDMGEQLADLGCTVRETDFAGYSPHLQQMFLYTGDEPELDKFEVLFSPLCGGMPESVVISVEGNGESHLIGKSGSIATLTRAVDREPVVSIKVEPTIGESGDILDFRFEYLDQTDSANRRSITTCLIMRPGKTTEVMSASGKDMAAKPLRVKADISYLRK
jgi:hypothetical protein